MDFQENDNNTQELMSIFQVESEEILERIFEELASLEKTPDDRELTAALYRNLHSIKGAIRMVGFSNIQMIVHKIEDIFDAVNSKGYKLSGDIINLIINSLELVSNYLQKSIAQGREIIDETFNSTLSNLEYIIDVELADTENSSQPSIIDIAQQETSAEESQKIQIDQEQVNSLFNHCFELIDSIVPEEESQETVILKEEVAQIYDIVKDTDLYEVKTSIQDVLTKLDFVMHATNTFTISEILEMRNALSSAAAKFNTSLIEVETSGITFFDIAEKITMLQSSSVYASEIKDDIAKIKETISDNGILEIINMIIENSLSFFFF